MAEFVIEGRVAAGRGLEPVEEIEHDLGQRQVVLQRHLAAEKQHFLLHPALLAAQGQDRAYVIRRHQDIGGDDGFTQLGNAVLGRQLGRIVDVDHGPVGEQQLIDDGRGAGDEIEVVLALQALLHDVHVQQPQESATKSETQRRRHLGLEMQRRIVELELLERIAELLVVVGTDGEHSCKDARLHLLESCERLFGRVVLQGNGVAHRGSVDFLDAGHDESDFPRVQGLSGHGLGREAAQPVYLVTAAGGHDADLGARVQRTIHDAHK